MKEIGKRSKARSRKKWAKLTDDDLTAINGRRDQLEGRLQQRYGYAKDQAEKELDEFTKSLEPKDSAPAGLKQ